MIFPFSLIKVIRSLSLLPRTWELEVHFLLEQDRRLPHGVTDRVRNLALEHNTSKFIVVRKVPLRQSSGGGERQRQGQGQLLRQNQT